MRISDWSSDVCSSDLMAEPGRALVQIVRLGKAADDPVQPLAPVDRGIGGEGGRGRGGVGRLAVVDVEDAVQLPHPLHPVRERGIALQALFDGRFVEIGRASCRERVWQYV